MNLRAKPIKEALSLVEQYLEEKEKQCASHSETTKEIAKVLNIDLEKRLGSIELKIEKLKGGWTGNLINIAVTVAAVLFLVLKKGF